MSGAIQRLRQKKIRGAYLKYWMTILLGILGFFGSNSTKKSFPYIIIVYNNIEEGDENCNPGAPANARHFYNKLLNFGKKMNKKQIGKIILHVNSFQFFR